MSGKGLAVCCRFAGSLKMPERGEKKKQRRDGGNDAVATHLANEAELKVSRDYHSKERVLM
jgi:hypothetical protein